MEDTRMVEGESLTLHSTIPSGEKQGARLTSACRRGERPGIWVRPAGEEGSRGKIRRRGSARDVGRQTEPEHDSQLAVEDVENARKEGDARGPAHQSFGPARPNDSLLNTPRLVNLNTLSSPASATKTSRLERSTATP